jgi:Spy/CpxP family protein refolding chaperone
VIKLCFLLMLPLALFAQPPRAFWAWWEGPIANDPALQLQPNQMRQIRDTVREFRDRMVDLRGAVEKAENQIEDVFNEENIDQKKASESIERLAQSRAEMTRAFSQLTLKLRSVLTAQQWHELQRRRPHGQPEPGPTPRPAPQPRRHDDPIE